MGYGCEWLPKKDYRTGKGQHSEENICTFLRAALSFFKVSYTKEATASYLQKLSPFAKWRQIISDISIRGWPIKAIFYRKNAYQQANIIEILS